MKLMIASDIHGSALYCSRLIEAYKKEGADKLFLLGDILYHGPRNDLPDEYNPKKVLAMLNEIRNEILCVRGNCDTEVDQMVLEFPVLAEYGIIWHEGRMFFMTHGHNFNRKNLPMLKGGDVLVNGHTHVPAFEREDGYIYINPGSVSIPKENSHRGYIILEGENVVFRNLEGETVREEKL